ncbi:MAG TPA: hypothetical protein VFZ25_05635 [Chloroflexota bacterium]|nr:hypothetical protein [Chloroflexota bacterium]
MARIAAEAAIGGSPLARTSGANPPPADAQEGTWTVQDGQASLSGPGGTPFRADGIEAVTYSNPFRQNVERVWFEGKIVYALDVGKVPEVDLSRDKVAQEYQIVYAVDLDEAGKSRSIVQVTGQLNIYDSVPGMDKYSPIWQFNYVVVPRDYQPNALRSAEDCQTSGYRIVRSNDFEN